MLSTTKERILQYIEYKNIAKSKFYNDLDIKRGLLDSDKLKSSVTDVIIAKILAIYKDLNINWLLTGEGNMLITEEHNPVIAEKTSNKRHLIPLFDITAIGGRNYDADMSVVSKPSEMIDTGDWFQDATAAMRVQGDSMSPEYKSGSIVALRQITDPRIIMYGEDYVVETDELRVIKRIQRSENPQCLMACSVNQEQWESGPMKGHLIHEPFEIPKDSIRRMFLVLGEVRRNHSCNIIDVLDVK